MSDENTTPEQAPDETPEAAATPEPASSESAPEKPARKPGWEKRIDVLTARLRAAERENAELKERQQHSAEPESTVAPRLDDFDSDEDYIAARARHEAQQLFSQAESKANAEAARKAREAEESAVASSVQKMFARGTDSHDDFEALVMSPTLPLTNEMLAALAATENGHDVVYHLAKNPAESDAIAELPPTQQAIAIGRLGERMANTQKAVSKAPAPVEPVNDTGSVSDPLSDKSDIDSWMKARAAQLTA